MSEPDYDDPQGILRRDRDAEPERKAWKALVAYAQTTGDGPLAIYRITSHYLKMQRELVSAQEREAKLQAQLAEVRAVIKSIADMFKKRKLYIQGDGWAEIIENILILGEHRCSASEAQRDQLAEALKLAQEQLAVGRRFLPSHGTFGEEGISAYQSAQSAARAALAELKKERLSESGLR